MSGDRTDPTTAIVNAVSAGQGGIIEAAIAAGRTVAAQTNGRPTDPSTFRTELEMALQSQNVLRALPDVLGTAAAAIDTPIAGDPVPAPPYVAVTSRGPLCRGTLADDRRLVITVALFVIERSPRQYRFRDPGLESALAVELREPES